MGAERTGTVGGRRLPEARPPGHFLRNAGLCGPRESVPSAAAEETAGSGGVHLKREV